MTLDELEKLAKDRLVMPRDSATILALIELARQLHHQLDLSDIIISDEYPESQLDEFYGRDGRHKALAAYEEFGK